MTMQPGTPEHAAELERVVAMLTRAVGSAAETLATVNRDNTALACCLAFLVAELERRGAIDRAELAEMAVEGARSALPDDPAVAQAVRDLLAPVVPGGPPRPGLRVIPGGKI